MKEARDPASHASANHGPVSVIVCSHRLERWEWLCASVRSIERQTIPVQDTVVVIDGNPGLAKLAVEELSDTCTVLTRDVCGGLSEARNLGLTVVSTPFVAFFDDDAEAEEDWLERLMEPLADPSVFGVGGHSIPLWDDGQPAWFPPELLWVVGCSYAGLPLQVAPIRNVFGGCAIYRHELFGLYGGFRSEFGRHQNDAAGCEETEFCLRVTSHDPNGKFMYHPHAIIHHHVPASRATVRYVAQRSFADGRAKTILTAHAPRGTMCRQLETETSYARRFVAPAFFSGLRSAPGRDSSAPAQSAVLAMSMLAAGCGLVAGAASVASAWSSARIGGWPFARAHRAERCDTVPRTGSIRVDSDFTASPIGLSEMTTAASVVVCAYSDDRWADTVAALESLKVQTVAPSEVILVIDHNERLFERASSLEGVSTIRNSGARGASGSRNSGVAAASGSVAVFLDDDAIADPDWLETLLKGYAQPNVAGVGGSISPEWATRPPRWFPDEFNWVVGCTYLGMPTTTNPIRNLIGANMSVRRDVWQRVGGFREGFGNVKNAEDARRAGGSMLVGCEETELCIRVSQALPNLTWIYEPSARVRHRVPDHRCTRRYFLSRCRKEGWAKAVLASVVGGGSALETERSYVRSTLTPGVVRQLRRALADGDVNGLRRAGAIVAGLSMTAEGFLEARVRMPAEDRPLDSQLRGR